MHPFATYPAGHDPRLKEETQDDREKPHPWCLSNVFVFLITFTERSSSLTAVGGASVSLPAAIPFPARVDV